MASVGVLVVDDEEQLGLVVGGFLRREGFEVFVASCLERAMALFRDNKERIQVLITDLVMPELFGDQFAMKLLAENPKLRVIVMSGNTPDLLQTAFPLKEGENFIRKPFRPADLLRLIVD